MDTPTINVLRPRVHHFNVAIVRWSPFCVILGKVIVNTIKRVITPIGLIINNRRVWGVTDFLIAASSWVSMAHLTPNCVSSSLDGGQSSIKGLELQGFHHHHPF